jgi:hypothetical protein
LVIHAALQVVQNGSIAAKMVPEGQLLGDKDISARAAAGVATAEGDLVWLAASKWMIEWKNQTRRLV